MLWAQMSDCASKEKRFIFFIILLTIQCGLIMMQNEKSKCETQEIVVKSVLEPYQIITKNNVKGTCGWRTCYKEYIENKTDTRVVYKNVTRTVVGCCDGYQKKNINGNLFDCEPICNLSCTQGYCNAPGNCTCNDGYKLQDGQCIPTCQPECIDGNCASPNICECYEGYTLRNSSTNVCVCKDNCVKCANNACIFPYLCSMSDCFVQQRQTISTSQLNDPGKLYTQIKMKCSFLQLLNTSFSDSESFTEDTTFISLECAIADIPSNPLYSLCLWNDISLQTVYQKTFAGIIYHKNLKFSSKGTLKTVFLLPNDVFDENEPCHVCLSPIRSYGMNNITLHFSKCIFEPDTNSSSYTEMFFITSSIVIVLVVAVVIIITIIRKICAMCYVPSTECLRPKKMADVQLEELKCDPEYEELAAFSSKNMYHS